VTLKWPDRRYVDAPARDLLQPTDRGPSGGGPSFILWPATVAGRHRRGGCPRGQASPRRLAQQNSLRGVP